MKLNKSTLIKMSALSVCLGLAACGGGSDNYGSSTPYPSTTPEPTAEPTPEPTAEPTPEPSNTPLSAALTSTQTLMGTTFTVEGDITVLRSVDGELSLENLDNKAGFSLYTFDNDEIDSSNCTSDGCITNWPPLLANENDTATAPLSIIERADGNLQWSLRGLPLYLFAGDNEAGDVNGEGAGEVWHTAVDEPVALIKSDVNSLDGVYLTAAGSVATSQEISDTAFTSQVKGLQAMSLYTFDNDDANSSNCNDGCLAAWPALLAQEGDVASAPYSIIDRQLGSTGPVAKQWALNGKPLYFFAGDTNPGDTAGKAIANWRLARPESFKVTDSDRGTILSAAGLSLKAAPADGTEVTSTEALDGFSLYTFDNDTAGTSNCSDGCLSNWPALIAPVGAVASAPYSLVERASGEQQWAINGFPLYFFAGDTEAGQVNGDEAGGVWHLARPAPVASSTHPDEGLLFIAKGNIVGADGEPEGTFEDFTVYIFEEDTEGLSTCFGGCATTWPPLFAPADAKNFGDFTVITRDNPETPEIEQEFQWSYKGQPLYFFVGDGSPGDTNGEYGTWFIARP